MLNMYPFYHLLDHSILGHLLFCDTIILLPLFDVDLDLVVRFDKCCSSSFYLINRPTYDIDPPDVTVAKVSEISQ